MFTMMILENKINEWDNLKPSGSIMRKDIIEASKLHFKAHIEKHRIDQC